MSESLDFVVLVGEDPRHFEKSLNQWKEYYILTINSVEFSAQGNVNAVITRHKKEQQQ